MQRITTLWNRGWVGKLAIVLGTFVLVCCVFGVVARRSTPTPTAAVPTIVAQAAAVEQPSSTSRPTETPQPAAVPNPNPTATPWGYFSRDMMGDEWPLTVDEGQIICSGSAILLRTNQGLFAVNGTARGQMKDKGWKDIRDITKPDPVNTGLIMSVQPIIYVGLERCK